MSNKVLITNAQKAVKVPSGLRILIRRACNAVLEYEKFEGPAEISVTFVDNAAIAELNNQYRSKPMPTDVLSFPLGEGGQYDVDGNNGCKMLGDIVISMERAMEQANLYGHSLQREVAFLTVHSMLHLLGYDHENGGLEAVRMREREGSHPFAAGTAPHGQLYRMRPAAGKAGCGTAQPGRLAAIHRGWKESKTFESYRE